MDTHSKYTHLYYTVNPPNNRQLERSTIFIHYLQASLIYGESIIIYYFTYKLLSIHPPNTDKRIDT